MYSFVEGFHYFLSGFWLIAQPGLKRYVIIPLCLNILVFIGLFFIFFHYVGEFNIWLQSMLPSWLQALVYLINLVFFVLFFLFFIYTFVMVSNIVCAPFNSFLSEKVEFFLTNELKPDRSFLENIKDIPRMIGRQIVMLIYYLLRVLVLFVLFFVPFAQPFIAMLWFLLNAWFMAMSYVDFPADNNRVSFKHMKDWLETRRGSALGFGTGAMIATTIPIINFLSIPAAVAGATKLWVEKRKN